MSFHKKLSVFVTVLIIVPMTILFFISTFVLDNQILHSEQSYLENALRIARNKMVSRKAEMQQGGHFLANSQFFKQAVQAGDKQELAKYVQRLRETYGYLDFVVILDNKRRIVANIPESINQDGPFEMNGLLEKVRTSKEFVFSEEVIALNKLFYPESAEFNKFRVKIVDGKAEGSAYFIDRCEVGVVIVPVFDPQDSDQLIGYIALGDVTNNDEYFPASYSKDVKGSYLAISIDGIRVTSNIRTPKKTSYVGSSIPITMNSLEGEKCFHFGRVNIDDEIHVFLDEPIIDAEGKVIGVLGVGIPEERFSAILSTNRNLIVIVTIVCLCIMLIVAKFIARRITRPILAATRFAEQVRRGERDLILKDEWLEDSKSETTILLKTFQKMAEDLKRSEDKRKEYLAELKTEHLHQQRLAEQLKFLNVELEEKVSARTQDLQQAILALKRADEVKSQFLANMSHELRTPLTSVICNSEVLKEKMFGPLTEKQEKYIKNILSSGTHLLQLINDILDICKIEAGKMKLGLSEFFISEIVENSYHVIKSMAYRKNIDLTIKMDQPDFKMKADAKKLKQILYNLLSNAIKFTPENGKVEVEIFKREEVVQFCIRDNGIGIKEEDQERVFKEFEQVDNSYERQYEGTGLGLPLTKKLIEMHGGEIYLTSKLGAGTEVIFTIPINTELYLHIST